MTEKKCYCTPENCDCDCHLFVGGSGKPCPECMNRTKKITPLSEKEILDNNNLLKCQVDRLAYYIHTLGGIPCYKGKRIFFSKEAIK